MTMKLTDDVLDHLQILDSEQPRYKIELTHKQLSEIEDFYEKRSQISIGSGLNREDRSDAFEVLAKINRIYSENAVEIWGQQT